MDRFDKDKENEDMYRKMSSIELKNVVNNRTSSVYKTYNNITSYNLVNQLKKRFLFANIAGVDI
jgi:hypothetical protein